MAWAIKTEVADPFAAHYAFPAQKTMYGGKRIAAGDVVFIFASKNAGGSGLVAKGLVTSAVAIPGRPGVARQTPRVGMAVDRTALGRRPLGRSRLKLFSRWNDGRPETERNFKLYRQTTHKVVGPSDRAAAFLGEFFGAECRRRYRMPYSALPPQQ
ncbi:MAG TPA: hypothetical protein VFY94_01370 [Rhodanobacteraceae bacterium]|jgi:hypothetical protein|nr:hypothetical protein [Rhodanobacteraceae bacterium]